MKYKVCMIVPSFTAKGGITTVVNGYRNSKLEEKYCLTYIETYCDGNSAKKIIKAIISYLKFICMLIVNKPEIVHIHSSFGASFYRKLPYIYISSFFNLKIVNHIHGSSIDKFYISAGKRKKRLVERTLNRCDCIICLSREWMNKLSVIKTKTKIKVIENYGIMHNDALIEKEFKKKVLFLGFITELKGCFDMPAIIERVVEFIPDIEFIIAGSGKINDMKEKLEEKKVLKNVTFPGWIQKKDKDILLRNCNVFFLPSYSEGMPMSILEAMGYGLPIVASNVGGIPQLVHNNVNGFLVEPGDIESYSNSLIKLLTNNVLAISMGKKSFDILSENFSFDKHIEKICEVYEFKD